MAISGSNEGPGPIPGMATQADLERAIEGLRIDLMSLIQQSEQKLNSKIEKLSGLISLSDKSISELAKKVAELEKKPEAGSTDIDKQKEDAIGTINMNIEPLTKITEQATRDVSRLELLVRPVLKWRDKVTIANTDVIDGAYIEVRDFSINSIL